MLAAISRADIVAAAVAHRSHQGLAKVISLLLVGRFGRGWCRWARVGRAHSGAVIGSAMGGQGGGLCPIMCSGCHGWIHRSRYSGQRFGRW